MLKWTARLMLIASLGIASPAFAATDLKAQTARLLEYWTGRTQSGKTLATDQLPADVLASFDYETFTSAAIQPHKEHFDQSQLARYQSVFTSLLRKTVHRHAGAALANTRYTVGKPVQKDGTATVDVKAHLPKDDLDTTVQFVWSKKGDEWKITDIVIDGSSLVLDYRNQFGRIIRKEGVSGLLAKLEKRLAGQSEESASL